MRFAGLLSTAVLVLVLALAASGCDSDSGTGSQVEDKDTRQAGDTQEPGEDTEVQPLDTLPGQDTYIPESHDYPTPPFGTSVGAVIKDHRFLNPEDGSVVRLSEYYQHEDKKLLLLNASAGWCSACRAESKALKKVYEEYKDKGFDILFTLFEDNSGGPVSTDFWFGWMNDIQPNYLTVLDTNFELGLYFNVEATPMNMLLDLETMEIIWLETGFAEDVLKGKLDTLLGQ